MRLALVALLTIIAASSLFMAGPSADAAFLGMGGGAIAFTSNRDGNWEVYVMGADGSSQTNLTSSPAWDGGPAGPPAWSPDGTKITFASDRDGNFEVYVMDADGSDVRRLTDDPANDGMPSWSPDSSQIVFSSQRDGNPEIYVMDADGADQRRLTNDPAWDLFPVWSPDGSLIAFQTSRDDPNPVDCIPDCDFEIYTMLPGGSGLFNITANTAADVLPDWNPRTATLAFESDRDGGFDIFTFTLNGPGPTNLSPGDGPIDTQPAWSPDAALIAFSSGPGAGFDIYRMAADGSGRTQLTSTAGDDMFPDWQPFPRGDASCGGGVNSIDALLVLQYGAGMILGSLPCHENADVNRDGRVDAVDAALILQYSARLLASLS